MSNETMKVDVLAVMGRVAEFGVSAPEWHDMPAARDAVAELIEVMQEAQRITRLALAERAIKGPLRSHFTGLSHRLTASLARVGGATP